jgi:hypothetical protein
MTDERYKAAVDCFLIEPEALTQDQLTLLKSVDDSLGDRAARKRSDAIQKAAEARHRAAMGELPLAKKSVAERREENADAMLDVMIVALAKPRSRIKALEIANASIEARCLALEQRVLELEASHAVSHVER